MVVDSNHVNASGISHDAHGARRLVEPITSVSEHSKGANVCHIADAVVCV